MSGNSTDPRRLPVYFLGHGGPTIIKDTAHPAYAKLGEVGKEITQQVKPKAVVVFSAHWQGGKNKIKVNTAEDIGLIYDFYGFPRDYYDVQYPHRGSKELAANVIRKLQKADIDVEGVERGLDHGVWVSFRCAFDPVENPLNVPIVQVSLFRSEDPDQHHKLGQAVQALRDEGVLIIVSGMAVHNLRDLWTASLMGNQPLPYTVSFDEALKKAVESNPEQRQKNLADILLRDDCRQAHPHLDHLLPIHIGAGAAGKDQATQLWTLQEGSVSWAQYRFGDVAV